MTGQFFQTTHLKKLTQIFGIINYFSIQCVQWVQHKLATFRLENHFISRLNGTRKVIVASWHPHLFRSTAITIAGAGARQGSQSAQFFFSCRLTLVERSRSWSVAVTALLAPSRSGSGAAWCWRSTGSNFASIVSEESMLLVLSLFGV